MPAYVRRQSLFDRIRSNLNIYDLALWLSEEIESNGWDQLEKEWAVPIGIVFNLLFLIARANVKTESSSYDDVFGEKKGPGWAASISLFLTYSLAGVCLVNSLYTFTRKRSYRLFEAPIETTPSTPSARRVKLNSSPNTASPLRFISSLIGTDSAESRAHPDAKQDIWEVSVWDPLPLSLRLFCYFSPIHVVLYWFALPTRAADPRPSITVATTIVLSLLLSLQLSLLSSSFLQQSKDAAYISKEVLREYDTKYVRPRTQPMYRDVTTQFSEQASYSDIKDEQYNKVVVFTPTHVIKRDFKINPNPDYSAESVADNTSNQDALRRTSTPNFRSPLAQTSSADFSSPLKPATAIRQPVFRPQPTGGHLGVYSHAASPLRKSASTSFTPARNSYIEDISGSRLAPSPEKHARARISTPGGAVPRSNAELARYEKQQFNERRKRRETGNF